MTFKPGNYVKVIRDSRDPSASGEGLGWRSDLPIGNIYKVLRVGKDMIWIAGSQYELNVFRFAPASNVEVLLYIGKRKRGWEKLV